jgi:hypothetical protein
VRRRLYAPLTGKKQPLNRSAGAAGFIGCMPYLPDFVIVQHPVPRLGLDVLTHSWDDGRFIVLVFQATPFAHGANDHPDMVGLRRPTAGGDVADGFHDFPATDVVELLALPAWVEIAGQGSLDLVGRPQMRFNTLSRYQRSATS